MRQTNPFLLILASTLLIAAGCENARDRELRELSRQPISIRGWIDEIHLAPPDPAIMNDLTARAIWRRQLIERTNMSVENVPWASGNLAENGAFVILDVPPREATVTFIAPGMPESYVRLENIPPSADVLIPRIAISSEGARLNDPSAVVVRVAEGTTNPTPFGPPKVNGHEVRVEVVPLTAMNDRRDFPDVPSVAEVAKVR